MRGLIACLALWACACTTLDERIVAYDDGRLCREIGRGSAHSKQAYVLEAARRKLSCDGAD